MAAKANASSGGGRSGSSSRAMSRALSKETPKETPKESKETKETRKAIDTTSGSAPLDSPSPPSGATGRTATINLPFVTAVFRAPDVHLPNRLPNREDLDTLARRAGELLPSGKTALYYGGLAATAVAGIIEWPVAAAIGVGTALARGRNAGSASEKSTDGSAGGSASASA